MLFCKRHWFMLPLPLRRAVWATYRNGQCDDWNPSRAYCEAAKSAVVFVANKEGREPDTRLYDFILGGGSLSAMRSLFLSVKEVSRDG